MCSEIRWFLRRTFFIPKTLIFAAAKDFQYLLRAFLAILIVSVAVVAVTANDAVADGDAGSDLTFPLRGIFYYPWYPQTWSVGGVDVCCCS